MPATRVDVAQHEGGRIVQFSQTRTNLGRPVYWVSAYWVDGVLIDAGPSITRDRFLAVLGGRRVEAIWITHHHEDHVGNVAPLQEQGGAVAYASAWATRHARRRRRLPWYRHYTWGEPDPGTLQALPRRVSTRRHVFDVVEVPGHTPGDVAFVEASEGWAFTGDLFLGEHQVMTRPRDDYCAILESLQRLLDYEPRILFTGMRVFSDAQQVLRRRIAVLKQVLHELDRARQQGLTPVQARRRLLGREPLRYYLSAGFMAKQNFVDQAYACLDHGGGSGPVGKPAQVTANA